MVEGLLVVRSWENKHLLPSRHTPWRKYLQKDRKHHQNTRWHMNLETEMLQCFWMKTENVFLLKHQCWMKNKRVNVRGLMWHLQSHMRQSSYTIFSHAKVMKMLSMTLFNTAMLWWLCNGGLAFLFTCRSLVSLTWLQSGNECNIFTVNATVSTVLCNLKISPTTSRRRWSLLPPIHFRESILLNGSFHSPSPAFG